MATEKRLIDANALKKQKTILWDEALGFCDCVLMENVEEAPTVDAVEVVRCKDCVRYNTEGCANGFGWCEAYDNGRMDNDFCSFGAKMDGEIDETD